jgi:hypothetical protein
MDSSERDVVLLFPAPTTSVDMWNDFCDVKGATLRTANYEIYPLHHTGLMHGS